MEQTIDQRTGRAGLSARVAGVDATRALAIIGMLMVHFGPKGETDLLGRAYALPHGRASILFVLVAGVGVALLSALPERHSEARWRLFAFALFLLPVGLALEVLKHPVAVILHHYAAFFLLGIAAIGLTKRALAICALAFTVIGPLIFYGGMMVAPRVFARHSVDLMDSPTAILSALLLTGPYPLIVWGAPLLWGMWIGRHDLRDQRLLWSLMAAGAGLAICAYLSSELLFAIFGEPGRNLDWRFLFADTAHSEMPLWLIGATGSAVFVVGATLLLSQTVPRAVALLADLGQVALTVYVAHILILTVAAPLVHQSEVVPAIISVGTFTVLAIAFAVTWRYTIGRGPVERMMHLTWQAIDAMRPAAGRDNAPTVPRS